MKPSIDRKLFEDWLELRRCSICKQMMEWAPTMIWKTMGESVCYQCFLWAKRIFRQHGFSTRIPQRNPMQKGE